jgi:DNA-binding response OmpR family regulator
MDIMMPDMNGYQTIKELKKDNKLKKTPVVIISALDDRDSKSRGLNVGASDFISKPYESEKVLTIIKEHLPDHLK